MAESMAPWAAPGPPAPPTRPQAFGAASAGPAPGTAAPPGPGIQPPAAALAPAPAKPARRSGTRPIPLRPLSILEVIDAGVGSLRSSPRRVHELALTITAGTCLLGLAGFLLFEHQVDTAITHSSYTSTDFFGNTVVYEGIATSTTNFGRFLTELLFAIVLTGMAATFTAGLYATSAQRYVDGQPPDPAAARAGYRGRLRKAAWVTVLLSIPRLIMLGLSVLLTLGSAHNPNGSAGTGLAWLVVLGVPVCWLSTALFAVAVPALMLERTKPGKALGRSRQLSQGGLWRSAWTCTFTLMMTFSPILLMLVYALYTRAASGDPGSVLGDLSTFDLALAAVACVLSVPLRATTSTMLYVDRRFRREGLDVRIAWARVAKETL
jgi:hypothetical protein